MVRFGLGLRLGSGWVLSYLIVILTNINKLMINVRRMLKNNLKNKITIK